MDETTPLQPGSGEHRVPATRSEASELVDLQMHWDESYSIGLDGAVWRARHRASGDELRAQSAMVLREMIRADFSSRQHGDRMSL